MIQTQSVTIPLPEKKGRALDAFLAMPQTQTQIPTRGVLVLHEAYGLNENIKNIARRFAENGYVALAVDLLSDGSRAICMFRAFYGLLAVPLKNGTVKNVRAAYEYLQKVEGVDAQRVGAIGFCMGGSYALQLACLDGTVRAISIVSGQNPRPLDAVARACPIVGSYPERDFTTGGGRELDKVLDEFKIPHEIKFYPDGIHSMFNDGAKGYSETVADDAWMRTLQFFDEHMRAQTA